MLHQKISQIMILVIVLGSVLLLGAQEDPYATYWQVLDKLERTMPTGTMSVLIGTEKERYELKEPVEIRFQASEPCHVILMSIGTLKKKSLENLVGGEIRFLLPNAKFLENKIEAGRIYSTLKDFDMHIKVGEPEGFETINIFCSSERIDLFLVDAEVGSYYVIPKEDEGQLQALLSRLTLLDRYEWAGNSVQVQIGNNVRDALIRGGLPPIGSTGSTGAHDILFPPIGSTGSTGKQ